MRGTIEVGESVHTPRPLQSLLLEAVGEENIASSTAVGRLGLPSDIAGASQIRLPPPDSMGALIARFCYLWGAPDLQASWLVIFPRDPKQVRCSFLVVEGLTEDLRKSCYVLLVVTR